MEKNRNLEILNCLMSVNFQVDNVGVIRRFNKYQKFYKI